MQVKRSLPNLQRPRTKELLLEHFADGFEHRLFVGEFAGLELRINKLTVDGDFKATATSRDEPKVLDLLFVSREQLGRQTDGLGFVISHRTVFEFQLHLSLLC